METQTIPIPAIQTAERKPSTTYTFREITEADELEKAFRLRYEVYIQSCNKVLVNENPNRVDINIFDLHSKHFGLFIGNHELVGYIRVVLDKKDCYNYEVFKIGAKYDLFNESEHSLKNLGMTKAADFPFLSFHGVPENIISHYNILKSQQEGFAEAGRIALSKYDRGVRTSTFLIECVVALYIILCMGQRHAIICCSEEHGLFYQRYGFSAFGSGETYDVHGTAKVSMCLSLPLSLSSSPIPKYLHPKLEGMAAEYSITGKITKTI